MKHKTEAEAVTAKTIPAARRQWWAWYYRPADGIYMCDGEPVPMGLVVESAFAAGARWAQRQAKRTKRR